MSSASAPLLLATAPLLLLLLSSSLLPLSSGESSIQRGTFLNGKWVSYPPSLHDCATSVLELATLKTLFTVMDGKNWVRPWDMTECPCLHNWKGVTCDRQGRVKALDLSANALAGTIAKEFGALSYLTSLRIDTNNGVSGTVPLFLSKLTGLQELFMFNTNLKGPVPGPVANLKRLESIFVDAPNRDQVRIPATLSKHKQVWVDSPFSITNEERTPPYWPGSLGGIDSAQANKMRVSTTPASG